MTNNLNRSRQPKGVPVGGQFSTEPKSETASSLSNPSPETHEFEAREARLAERKAEGVARFPVGSTVTFETTQHDYVDGVLVELAGVTQTLSGKVVDHSREGNPYVKTVDGDGHVVDWDNVIGEAELDPEAVRDADRRQKYQAMLEAAYPADDPDGTCDPQRLRSVLQPSLIAGQAHRFYDYLESHNIGPDSYTRETAFAYAAADMRIDYNDLYEAWVEQKPLELPCRACGTVIEAQMLGSTRECPDCVGAWVREATKRRR